MLPAVITHPAMTSAGATLLDKAPLQRGHHHDSVEHCAAADLLSGHRIMVRQRVRDSIITMLYLGHPVLSFLKE